MGAPLPDLLLMVDSLMSRVRWDEERDCWFIPEFSFSERETVKALVHELRELPPDPPLRRPAEDI